MGISLRLRNTISYKVTETPVIYDEEVLMFKNNNGCR